LNPTFVKLYYFDFIFNIHVICVVILDDKYFLLHKACFIPVPACLPFIRWLDRLTISKARFTEQRELRAGMSSNSSLSLTLRCA